jgi:hypothetical protein
MGRGALREDYVGIRGNQREAQTRGDEAHGRDARRRRPAAAAATTARRAAE